MLDFAGKISDTMKSRHPYLMKTIRFMPKTLKRPPKSKAFPSSIHQKVLLWAFISLYLALPFLTIPALGQDKAPRKKNESASGSVGRELRVLTYNIHHGVGMDGKLDLKRIAKVILSERPDLVALQEVDVKVKRSNVIDQAETLGKLCKMNFAFGGNIKLQGGEYGNAILSKYEFVENENTKLPNFEAGEQRGILTAKIKVQGLEQPLDFFSTHFDHRRNDTERFLSAQAVNAWLEATKASISIVAGDFNDEVHSRTITELEKSWVRSNDTILPTIPVKKPTRQIDFVFASKNSKLTCLKTKVLNEAVASDHRAVLAIYQIDSK